MSFIIITKTIAHQMRELADRAHLEQGLTRPGKFSVSVSPKNNVADYFLKSKKHLTLRNHLQRLITGGGGGLAFVLYEMNVT